MATITYPVGLLTDDSGAVLTAPVVTIASVTDKAGTAIASPATTVNGSGGATPISVDYDADLKGEAWITLSISQSGRTVTGTNATIPFYASKDSSRVITNLATMVSSPAQIATAVMSDVSDVIGVDVVAIKAGTDRFLAMTNSTPAFTTAAFPTPTALTSASIDSTFTGAIATAVLNASVASGMTLAQAVLNSLHNTPSFQGALNTTAHTRQVKYYAPGTASATVAAGTGTPLFTATVTYDSTNLNILNTVYN